MSLYQGLLRPLLFTVDPEKAHNMALNAITNGLMRARKVRHEILQQEFFGKTFHNPLGLAAGFDKNGEGLAHWGELGFGYAEIGTVTFHAQPGNDKPRMFRLPADQGLINRLGFNNNGAEALCWKLRENRSQIPIGINLGKSKITPIEQAAEDYRKSFRLLHGYGDYFVVNVSSPNTPGLRSLQERGPLTEIIQGLQEINPQKPLFIKVAPDLEFDALDEVVSVATEAKIAGLIATNTTISREGITTQIIQEGGMSGRPLKVMSDRVLGHLYQTAPKDMILIGIGGIFNGQDLFDKIALGAHLCQVYTGWVYGGLPMVPDSLDELVRLMNERGMNSLAELRGSAHATRP